MKEFILYFCICASLTTYAQVKMSQEQFDGLSPKNKNLYINISKADSVRTVRISKFLILNPNVNRIQKNVDGKVYILTDVIANKPIYTTLDNNSDSAIGTQTNHLQVGGSLGLDLDGSGITVAVWDGGPIQTSHTEFLNPSTTTSRVVNLEGLNTDGDPAQDDHGNHVTGTIAARGVNPNARGMATNVSIRTYNFLNDTPEMINAVTNPINPIILSNHSYGVPINQPSGGQIDSWLIGAYTSAAREVDLIIKANPSYLPVYSAGNSGSASSSYPNPLFAGFDRLTGNKNSKNNLVVANSNTIFNFFTNKIDFTINDSSSKGPTDDLRIKPDITGDGTNVLSPITNDAYGTLSGTSMSAPNVTGSIVLLQQYYNQIYGVYMQAATAKGLVCHTALDDANIVGPDPTFGWGLLNSRVAAETITKSNNNQAVISELNLVNNDTYSLTFNTLAGDEIKATICWTDVAGATTSNGDLNNNTPKLINDLDLRISKDGIDYLPWRLEYSPTSGFSNSKGDNIRDNVERIDFVAPTSGTYTLTVSHKGTLQGPTPFDPSEQDYSLILTGTNLTLSTNDVNFNDSLTLYPNPTSDYFDLNFGLSNTSDISVKIYDINARLVKENTFNNYNNSIFNERIQTDNLTPGIYMVKVSNGNNITTKRLIIN